MLPGASNNLCLYILLHTIRVSTLLDVDTILDILARLLHTHIYVYIYIMCPTYTQWVHLLPWQTGVCGVQRALTGTLLQAHSAQDQSCPACPRSRPCLPPNACSFQALVPNSTTTYLTPTINITFASLRTPTPRNYAPTQLGRAQRFLAAATAASGHVTGGEACATGPRLRSGARPSLPGTNLRPGAKLSSWRCRSTALTVCLPLLFKNIVYKQ